MGHVFHFQEAQRYDEWFQSEPGRSACAIEKELLQGLWSPSSPQRVLEVGCGTGLFLEWFSEQGHLVTGLDPSPYMLNIARRRLPERVSLERGYAEELPYEDNSFDTVALITTLEFVDDPLEALREAVRVARRHVLLGVLNKYSLTTSFRYIERLWKSSLYSHARFFSVFGLRRLAHTALSGSIPLRWGTCLALPLRALPYVHALERSRYFHWHPFGHFIGMRIDLCYPVQTIQQPIFHELPCGIGNVRFHITSCWLSRDKDRGPFRSTAEQHRGSPKSRDARPSGMERRGASATPL